MSLNFKHLRYFWAVAHSGNLTRAAEQLFVSQSALSVQIRKLEEWLGHDLFERQGKRLVLTEAGRIALDHADTIFGVGEELVSTLKGEGAMSRQVLRVGALSTLSRNFQSRYLEPLFGLEQLLVVVRSGNQEKLLADLENHECDVVLTNVAPTRDSGREWIVNALDEQPVSLIGKPSRVGAERDIEALLSGQPLIVPTMENTIRIGFDALCDRLGIQPTLRAEVDDMALIRVLARADMGLAVIPPIVVRDELASGTLEELVRLSSLTETFYAITVRRRFPNPLLSILVENLAAHS
jgi:LysR family transcriptional activator of nhaA